MIPPGPLWELLVVLLSCCVKMYSTQEPVDPYDPPDPCASCEKKYTYRGARSGTFVSPGFPENYPERITCCYFFHSSTDGRVKLEFDYFDLEDPSENGCQFDYIAISSINDQGYKEPKSIYCGSATPPTYISTHSKLEIVFHSDFTKNAKGFLGHYEFLATNWHPFYASTIGCGPGYLTGPGGIIETPNYPGPYPAEAECTWIIKVEPEQQILLNFISLDITANAICKDTTLLMLFDGFVSPETLPMRYCGQLKHESTDRREFLSTGDRLVVRFQSGQSNPDSMQGFRAAWTAVTLTGTCEGFQCEKPSRGACSARQHGQLCNNNNNKHYYCIHPTMQCNEYPNCGAFDSSDETKCLTHVLMMVGYIGGPVVALVGVAVIVVCCYRRYCSSGRPSYAVPKAQSMSQSIASTQCSSLHVRSLEHSPRSSCVMYTTSFTDCTVSDRPATDTGADQQSNHAQSNSLPLPHTPPPPPPTHRPDDGVSEYYKAHQKRDSYHMMRELCYEDGSIVVADI